MDSIIMISSISILPTQLDLELPKKWVQHCVGDP